MSRVIWKEQLDFKYMSEGNIAEVELPASAQLLHVGPQGNTVCVWFSVLPEHPAGITRAFRFALVPTGGVIPERGVTPQHLTTFLVENDSLVFHVFQL